MKKLIWVGLFSLVLLLCVSASAEVFYFPDPGFPLDGSCLKFSFNEGDDAIIESADYQMADAPEGVIALEIHDVDMDNLSGVKLDRKWPSDGYATASGISSVHRPEETLYAVRIQTSGMVPGYLMNLFADEVTINFGDSPQAKSDYTDDIAYIYTLPDLFNFQIMSRSGNKDAPKPDHQNLANMNIDIADLAIGESKTLEVCDDWAAVSDDWYETWQGSPLCITVTKEAIIREP